MRYAAFLFVAACAALSSGLSVRLAVADNGNPEPAVVLATGEPHWTVSVGSVFLNRSKPRPGPLVFNGTTSEVLADVSDFDLGWAVGPDIELTRHVNPDWDVGLRYFSVDGWNATKTLVDPGHLRVPMVSDDPGDFFDTTSGSYASRFYSTELNLKKAFGERLQVLAGFRMVGLFEEVASSAYSPSLEGTFDIRSSNHLYGFQMGVEGIILQRGRFELDGYLKAGVYGNSIRGTIYGDGTYFHEEVTDTINHTSFLGEMGLNAKYQFNRRWSVYGGYQLMWLQGVGLAGDYISLMADPSSTFDILDGAAFYHGARAGLQFTW